jgi:stage II sporulation protein D
MMRVRTVVCGLLFSMLLTVPAEAGSPIRVLLAQDTQRVVVSADRGMVVRCQDGPEQVMLHPVAVMPVANGTGIVVNGERLPSDVLMVTGRGGDLALAVGEQPDNPLVVSGSLLVLKNAKGLIVINHVDLEEYVKGVVPSEMSSGWHPEALKTQAVVTRTYGLYQQMVNKERDYDVVASTQDQVYRGRFGLDQRVQQAVETTRGLVLTHRNAPILAAFSSTAAGPTEDAMNVWSKDLPYLKGVDCPFDQNSPYYQWRAEFKLQDLEENLRRQGLQIGTIASLTPVSYSSAGRVTRLRLLHSKGELILRGEELRRVMGYGVIPSTQFEVEAVGRTVVLSGRGAGHAVGLCQWGAKELAGLGYPFASILLYYFPGTELKDLRFVEPAASSIP